MGPPSPQQQQQGLCFSAPWPWGCADGDSMDTSLDGGGGGGGGGPGLRFLLQLDRGQPALDNRTLLGFSLSALLTRLLGRGRGAIAGDGGESGSAAAALAAAVSLSLAAAMYASDRRTPPRARRPPLPAPSSVDSRAAAQPRAPLPAPQDGLRILSSSSDESLDNVIHGASIGAGDDDGPDIVARVETEPTAPAVSQTAEDETDQPDRSEQEELQELERLRELWLSLVEREQRLELRLQEHDALRWAQEASVRELEGRVAAAATEERLLQLQLSALQEENGRLRAQADELSVARAELARAKEKLRAIKARVQAEEAAAAALRATVAELERGRDESGRALAAEIADLRKANAALEEENLELALRLQDAEQAADGASVNLILQEDMAEETKYLRESNERLTRQIEELRNDHCAHVEELVYLKWVNACLRHELLRDPTTTAGDQQDHHHHAGDGAAAAGATRDLTALELSKSMSFRSSERAKQLMLRYGHPGLDGFGSPGLFSPLHESSVDGDGDERSPARRNYESERSPYYARRTTEKTPAPTTSASAAAAAAPGNKKAGPRKLRFLGNIKKMLPGGKRSHSHSAHGHGHTGGDGRKAAAPAPSDEYLEKAMRWLSTHDVLDGDHSYDSTPLYSSCERTPVSSVTTNTTADDSRAACGGGGGHSEHGGEATRRGEGEPVMARSKSDAGGSYGREVVSRYHALRPDHPAAGGVEPDGFRAPEKPEGRRRSEGLRSPLVT